MSLILNKEISIEWTFGTPGGKIRVLNGTLIASRLEEGPGSTSHEIFNSANSEHFRIAVTVEGTAQQYGKGSTVVNIDTVKDGFSFFLRDVSSAFPILIEEYGVLVTESSDRRCFDQVKRANHQKGTHSRLQQIAIEPEESFETASEHVRAMVGPTWLGLSRDMRIFCVGERLDWIEPRFHYIKVPLPEANGQAFKYELVIGQGWGPTERIERRLEDGTLPILHGLIFDNEIEYSYTAFVSLEKSPLTMESVRGTDYIVADAHARGNMLTVEQQARYRSVLPEEMNKTEETVLFVRVTARNTAPVPRYAFVRTFWPSKGTAEGSAAPWSFESATGFSKYGNDDVFVVSKLNGEPLSQEEVAILLKPQGTATLDIFFPHRPIPRERALALVHANFDERYREAKTYWNAKLGRAARIKLPEKRIDEMIRAGLLHLDLITYGREPNEALAATIGNYSPIGSESAPIIQFFDSMGWHDVARRSLHYFLEKQHSDGFIQNFNNYMLETGAVLWCIGEHYRYTRDDRWVREITPRVLKSCEFLSQWRERNLRDDLLGRGYGMLDGKTADPDDPFRSFMLNGYTYLGLSRVGEMLETTNVGEAHRWKQQAEELRKDIRTSFAAALAASPVIPLGDGNWCPTCPPWPESVGALSLLADNTGWYTHGAMGARDSLLGPLYLAFQEVLSADEQATTFLLSFHSELLTSRNVGYSQPYYSRHPILHLMRDETKAFLKAYYNTVASLADRSTYSFWEHYFHASPHKTHEEAWFLMDTRWMLYLERGTTLILLRGVPRAYLAHGKTLKIENAASYFGPFSFHVESNVDQGHIHANLQCDSDRRPQRVALRLPHPTLQKALHVSGGRYDPHTETVTVDPFTGKAAIDLQF